MRRTVACKRGAGLLYTDPEAVPKGAGGWYGTAVLRRGFPDIHGSTEGVNEP